MMVSMAALQVFVVRFFFQGARKGGFYLLFLSFYSFLKDSTSRSSAFDFAGLNRTSANIISLQVTCDEYEHELNNMMHYYLCFGDFSPQNSGLRDFSVLAYFIPMFLQIASKIISPLDQNRLSMPGDMDLLLKYCIAPHVVRSVPDAFSLAAHDAQVTVEV